MSEMSDTASQSATSSVADQSDSGERNSSILSMLGSALPFVKSDYKLLPTSSANTSSAISATTSTRTQRRKAVTTLGSGSYSLDDYDGDSMSSGEGSPETKDPESRQERSVAKILSGLKFASSKRNAEFHKVFPKLPSNEPLIDDFTCALAREILLQGRMYVTPHHVCFHSNILGWTTHLVIAFKEVIDIQTKTTAGIFPNGITIQKLHQRHNFATFVNRDSVIKLLRKIWQSPLNVGDHSEDSSEWSSDEETSTEDGSSSEDEATTMSRKGASRQNSKRARAHSTSKGSSSEKGDSGSNGGWPVGNLGPDTHAPTEIPQPDSKEKVLDKSTISAPLGVVVNLIYGEDTTWYEHFITDVEGNKDLKSIPPFKDEDGKKSRSYEYVKPLNGPVGPKQTRCLMKEVQEAWDMEDKVVILTTTRTPDVPNGDIFTVYSRTTLAWGENNKTVIQQTSWVEWTGKSWIKTPVEKGAMEGQQTHSKTLAENLEGAVKSGSSSKRAKSQSKKRPKKEETAAPEPKPTALESFVQSPVAIVGTVVGILLLILVIWHFAGHRDKDAEFLEQELKLWKWLDDRTVTNDIDYSDMSKRDINEVIELTEQKLAKLREYAD